MVSIRQLDAIGWAQLLGTPAVFVGLCLMLVGLHFPERLLDVGRIHLMATPVTELGCRVGRVAERSIKGGAVLGRIRHDADLLESLLVETLADGRHPAIHHV